MESDDATFRGFEPEGNRGKHQEADGRGFSEEAGGRDSNGEGREAQEVTDLEVYNEWETDLHVHLLSGYTLFTVSDLPGMPSKYELLRRYATDSSFRDRVNASLRNRTVLMSEQALAISECTDKQSAAADKLRIDTLKWLCEIHNPERYNPRHGGVSDGTPIMVDTGIERMQEGDPEPPVPVIDVPGHSLES